MSKKTFSSLESDEKNAYSEWVKLCNRQGWDDEVQVIHLEGFVEKHSLMSVFVAYAKICAVEENRGAVHARKSRP